MTRVLCCSPRCRIRGRHQPGCDEPACTKPRHDSACCTGCQPRPAADGLRLCTICTERIAEDAVSAAVLHAELAERLMAGTGTGERVAGTTAARIPNPDAVEARADIEHFLTWWTRLICQERGHHLPQRFVVEQLPDGFIGPPRRIRQIDDRPKALGAFIAKHHLWLAAHRWAHYAAVELHELAHGAPRRIAYPTGTSVRTLREPWHCPTCNARLTAVMRPDSPLLPADITCDGPEPHTWPAFHWRELRKAVNAKKTAA